MTSTVTAAPPATSAVYSRTAQGFHWLLAVMLLGMLALGFYMEGLPLSPTKLKLYSWHKWTGVTIFMLVLARTAWRLTHRPPSLSSDMPAGMQRVAHAGHITLYILMLIIPLSGWLMSSAKGIQTVWFGVLPLPDLLPKDKALGDFLEATHANLNLLFAIMVAGHIAMALKHHFIDRDGTLRRMLPVSHTED